MLIIGEKLRCEQIIKPRLVDRRSHLTFLTVPLVYILDIQIISALVFPLCKRINMILKEFFFL